MACAVASIQKKRSMFLSAAVEVVEQAQVLDGSVRVTLGGRPVALAAGEMALTPPNVPHAVLAAVKMKMLLTMLEE